MEKIPSSGESKLSLAGHRFTANRRFCGVQQWANALYPSNAGLKPGTYITAGGCVSHDICGENEQLGGFLQREGRCLDG
jgi:hypothetical protein